MAQNLLLFGQMNHFGDYISFILLRILISFFVLFRLVDDMVLEKVILVQVMYRLDARNIILYAFE